MVADKHVILFLAANPGGTDRPGLDREARAIRDELERAGHRDRFTFETLLAAEPLDLLRGLRKLRPTVVHYCGRGEDDGLYFQGAAGRAAVVSGAAFAEAFGAAGGSVKLVVLSACYSEEHTRALLDHVDCVVGMAGSIHPDAARSFAVGFYGGLGEGESVAAAFRQGCAAIRLEHDRPRDASSEVAATGLDANHPQLALRSGVDVAQLILAVPPLPAVPEIGSAPPTAVPVFMVYAAEDRAHHVELEKLLAPFGHAGTLVVVGRREVDGIRPFDDAPHPRAEGARMIVLLVSKHLLYADYFSRAVEIKQARSRHAHGRALVVSVQLGSAAVSATWLAGHSAIAVDAPILESSDPDASLLQAAKDLGRLAASLSRATDGGSIPEQQFRRNAYLGSVLERMQAVDEEGRAAFVEPRKEIVDATYDRAFELPSVGPEGEVPGESMSENRTRRTMISLTRLLDKVQTARVAALLGEPGSGKSLLLLELACALARRAARDPAAPIPVHVRLGSFTAPIDEEGAFGRFLVDSIADGPADEVSLAPELLVQIEQGRVVLLCDGLDELPRGDFRGRVHQVSEFARKYERCRVLLSCRSNDFPPELDLQRILIAPFGAAEISTYLSRTLGKPRSEAQALTAQLTSPESPLNALVTRPFFLSVIARYIQRRGRIPQETREVFEDLLQRPRMLRALSSYSETERAALHRGLDDLARVMLGLGGVGTAVSPAPVLARLAEPVGRDRAAALVDLGVTAGLLERDREGAIRFFHPLIQEFLVSRAIAALLDAEREAWLLHHVDDPWLREIYVFIAQQRVRLDRFVAAICAAAAEQLACPATAEPADRIAREWELLRHELRFVLVGRLIDAGAEIAPTHYSRLADLLTSLESGAHQRLGPRGVVARVLRAMRGPALSEPRLRALVNKHLRGPSAEHARDALIARASYATTEGARRYFRREIRWHALVANYPLRFIAYRGAVVRDARCMFLRGAMAGAAVLHGALSLLGLALFMAASYHLPWESVLPAPALLCGAGVVLVAHLVSLGDRGIHSPAVAVLRGELAGAITGAAMAITLLGADSLIAWLGPRAIAVPHGLGDRDELTSVLDIVRCAAVATATIAMFAEASAKDAQLVRPLSRISSTILWGALLGCALLAMQGYLEGTLPAWVRLHLVVVGVLAVVVAVAVVVTREVMARSLTRAGICRSMVEGVKAALDRVEPDRRKRRAALAMLAVGGCMFIAAELGLEVLIPAGGAWRVTGIVLVALSGALFCAFLLIPPIVVWRPMVLPNFRSLAMLRKVAGVDEVTVCFELFVNPHVNPWLRRQLARHFAKMNPPSRVVAVLFQSLLLDEFAAMPHDGANRKSSGQDPSWKRDRTLESAIDALQTRLQREDAAPLDDELRLLEAIRATHSEHHWKAVCGAFARLTGGHREVLAGQAAVHRSAAEVFAQLPCDGERGAAS